MVSWGSRSVGYALLVLLNLISVGCVFVRPGSSTVFEIQTGRYETVTVGMSEAVWCHGRFFAHGWHPKEHQTRAFVVSEPLPDVQSRMILVEWDTNRTDVVHVRLWLMGKLLPGCEDKYSVAAHDLLKFSGVGSAAWDQGRRQFRLDVSLKDKEARLPDIRLTGIGKGEPMSCQEVDSLLGEYGLLLSVGGATGSPLNKKEATIP